MRKQEMVDNAVKEAQREYFREWRAKNPDKVKNHRANYWRRKAEQKLAEAKGEHHGTTENQDIERGP